MKSSRSDLEQEKKVFGKTSESPQATNTTLNLNPETGYGPEIITNFNFQNTNIADLTTFMQKETGLNLVIAEDVNKSKKISITASSAITVGDAWKAYLSALNYSGYALVKKDAFYYIVPLSKAANESIQIYTGEYSPNVDTYFMSVLSPKYLSSTTLHQKFTQWIKNEQGAQLIDIPETNKLIVGGRGSFIRKLKDLLKIVDVEGYKESIRYIKIEHYAADEMAEMLVNLLPSTKQSGSTSILSKASNLIKRDSIISNIIPEQRTNSIIAMANDQGFKELQELIKKIDKDQTFTISEKMRVHHLKHAKAEELAKTLEGLVSSGKSSSKASKSLFQQEVKITADKDNNALIVVAGPLDWQRIKPIIEELDVGRLQVYIEGIIMETSLSKNKNLETLFGGKYHANNDLGQFSTASGQGGFMGSSNVLGNATNSIGFGLSEVSQVAGAVLFPGVESLASKTFNLSPINGVIKAIASSGNTNILSTPQILAMDNTPAEINLTEENPYVDSSFTGTGKDTITVNKTEFQAASTVIKITPMINKTSGFVKLKIEQKIEDFLGNATGSNGRKGKAMREFKTEIAVKNKDTIVMGGFLKDKQVVSGRKVPILGDIPFLGWLFKAKTGEVEKTNLLFFWTPIILDPYDQSAMNNTQRLLLERKYMLDELLGVGKDPMKEKVDKIQKSILKNNPEKNLEIEMNL
jgi:general secretion pathway protein D